MRAGTARLIFYNGLGNMHYHMGLSLVIALLICVSGLVPVIGAESSDGVEDSNVTIEFNKDTGVLSYHGTVDADLINVVVYGNNYISPVNATVVKNGSFTDEFYLGNLESGEYTVRLTGSGFNQEKNFFVGQSQITLDNVTYNADTGVLSFGGKSGTALVNVRVYSEQYHSPVTACVINNGCYSDSLYLGPLTSGLYTVEVSYNLLTVSKQFTVGGNHIIIESVSFSDGLLSYSGKSTSDLVNVVIYGHNYMSDVNASVVKNGSFSDIFYLGSLDAGTYTVRITGIDCSAETQFVIDTSDPYAAYSTYSQDGKTLIEYRGSAAEYVLPSFIEIIAEGAFDKATIDRFVLTKDVVWNIKIRNDTFPLQLAGVKEVVIQEGVTQIPDYLFACTKINSLILPASVESVGSKAFYNCTNLETVTVANDNHLELLDAYAFGTNPSLSEVNFGSSSRGYSCTLELGCFFNCGSLDVRLDPGFNLYSIGRGAFSNLYPDANVRMLIGDEDGNIIHIPGTVGYLGEKAFSSVLDVYSTTEPGKNTLRYFTMLKVSKTGEKGTTGRSIIFEDNDVLTSIEYGCFEGVAVDEIDLSGCRQPLDIYTMAFAFCLDGQKDNSLKLPSNVQRIREAAFECRGDITALDGSSICLPASLERLEEYAFDGLFKNITFQEGSNLRYYAGSPAMSMFSLVDLSNCSELEEFGPYCTTNPLKLPVGVFKGQCAFVLDQTPLATIETVSSGTDVIRTLKISADTVAIMRSQLENISVIDIDESNSNFRIQDGSLYQINNGKKLILTLDVKSLSVDETYTSVGFDAINSSVRTLKISNSNVTINSPIVTGASGLKNIYIDAVPAIWSPSVAFKDLRDGVSFYVTSQIAAQDIAFLKTLGDVYLGYSVGGSTVYLPEDYEGKSIVYTNLDIGSDSISAKVFIGGYAPESLDMVALGANATYFDGTLTINDISSLESTLRLFGGLSYSDEKVSITFEGVGGFTSVGEDRVTIVVPSGSVLSPNSFPVFVRDSFDFTGWADETGSEFTSQTVIARDMVVKAEWSQRQPTLSVDQTVALVYCEGERVSTDKINVTGPMTFTASPRSGYELGKWVLNGIEYGDASQPFTIDCLSADSILTISATYVSPSTGQNDVNNRGMPTDEEIADIVHAYTIGGYVRTSGSVWSGMVSIPLIVDDYVYLRVANKLYKAESDTGYIVKSVESKNIETFYHYLGYGGGYIIDYNTSKVYDTDLNQLYVLDKEIDSADYHDGRFYILGKYIYSFDPADEDTTRNDEVKTLDYLGRYDNIYGQYGIILHEYVDGVIYCVAARGDDRGIVAIDVSSGESAYKWLRGVDSMYLDDGWLSYYNGYLFLTGYSTGLFGTSATPYNDRVSYVPVNGLNFGEEKWYEFDGPQFASRFAFYDDRAFVSMNGTLYVFDLPEDMSDLDLSQLVVRKATMNCGHGNFVLDVSHVDEDGAPIYVYGIPYDTHYYETMWIAVDRAGETTAVASYSTEREWNSQTVRSDIDGRMLWYNDSGWLYSYTTSDKNVYYFFIEDGDSAVWYRAYGVNAADALASLGNDVATLNSAKIIQSINGHSVRDGITLQMLKATYGTVDNNGQFDNLDQYSWVTITNLGDVSYSLNHYFRIICGNGESVTVGTEFSYVEDGERKTYTFADNIGDRSIIGKQLSRGTDIVFIRFMEDDTEIPGTTIIVKRGSEAKVHFPDIVKVGYIPIWKNASGEEVADIYGSTFSSDATFRLHWEEIPAGYMVSGTMDVTNGVTTWSADVDIRTGIGTTEGLSIKVTAVTSDGRILTDTKTTGTNGLASGSLDAANIRLLYIRIVDEHVEGNLGYVMIEREATS